MTEIILTRDVFKGCIVITEGANDIMLLEKFSSEGKTQFLPAGGRENAVAVLELANSEGHVGIISIIDSDFDSFKSEAPECPGLFRTDFHDIEMMVLAGKTFKAIAKELCSAAKLSSFTSSHGTDDLLHILCRKLLPFSKVKLLSSLQGLRLCFRHFSVDAITNKDSLEVDVDHLFRLLRQYNRLLEVDFESVRAESDALQVGDGSLPHITNGHDVLQLFGFGLRKRIGNERVEVCASDHLHRIMRLAFPIEDFKKTTLFKAVSRWQIGSGFQVFIPT